jgi:hypothetical protein
MQTFHLPKILSAGTGTRVVVFIMKTLLRGYYTGVTVPVSDNFVLDKSVAPIIKIGMKVEEHLPLL